ncbi:MAG: VCBS repeat-containing protein, partial [Gemmatimonadota bacterium]|nr:VCBS repeat-containing protein [Gemmatimonadota bacterium]
MRLLVFLFLIVCLSCAPSREEIPVTEDAVKPTWTHLSTETGDLPAPSSSEQQTASLVLDVDKDGVCDIVIGCRKSPPSMVWYKRHENGWTKLPIDTTTLAIEAGGTYWDIDSDGDLDIVMGADASDSKVWWWENPWPDYSAQAPWVRREIKSGGENKHHDQMFGDFDGDGAAELVFWNQRAKKLIMAEIPADPRQTEPWDFTAIYTWKERKDLAGQGRTDPWKMRNEHEGLAKADIDGDGKLDIIGGGRWFKHLEGKKFQVNVIDASQHFTRSAAGQLIKGGRPEVVLVMGDGNGPIKYYEWNEGRWIGRDILGHNVWHGHSLDIVDLDGDGNLDIFCAEMNLHERNPYPKAYAFLGNGQGRFSIEIVAEGHGNHESRVADLDGDGDIDIMGKPYNWRTPRLDIWLNDGNAFRDLTVVPFERIVIDENGPEDPHTKATGDIDGDGIVDAVAASSRGGPLVWYQAPGWRKFTIAPSGKWSCDAEVADVDGDGDNDVVISEYYGKERLEWYENPGGAAVLKAGYWKLHTTGAPRAHDIEVRDMDSDGDMDIISRGQSGFNTGEGNKIVIMEQQDGPDSWNMRTIDCPHGEGLDVRDLDGDGDLDLVIGGRWYEGSNDIAGGPWKEHVFALWHEDAVVKAADMNRDGRLDVIITESEGTHSISWFEAPADLTQPDWPEHVIDPKL